MTPSGQLENVEENIFNQNFVTSIVQAHCSYFYKYAITVTPAWIRNYNH